MPGLPNPAGTLFLHLAGNLQHFLGAILGHTGYVRNRVAEFSRRGVPRSEIRRELEGARQGVLAGFANLSEEHLARPFPVQLADGAFSTQLTLLQFLSHLAYHLGQIDYHRRVVTGDSTSAHAISVADLLGRTNEPRV
ncbi:MAG: DinB family protein [Deinococcus-Thermus bacterium]|nr:MAG: DinB family protein [Deinococcota bacterium]